MAQNLPSLVFTSWNIHSWGDAKRKDNVRRIEHMLTTNFASDVICFQEALHPNYVHGVNPKERSERVERKVSVIWKNIQTPTIFLKKSRVY